MRLSFLRIKSDSNDCVIHDHLLYHDCRKDPIYLCNITSAVDIFFGTAIMAKGYSFERRKEAKGQCEEE